MIRGHNTCCVCKKYPIRGIWCSDECFKEWEEKQKRKDEFDEKLRKVIERRDRL